MKYSMKFITALVMLIGFSFNVHADHHGEKKRVFTENEFISLFSGKPKSRVLKYLGKPDTTDIAIKPKGASSVLGRPSVDKKNPNKKSKIESVSITNFGDCAKKLLNTKELFSLE